MIEGVVFLYKTLISTLPLIPGTSGSKQHHKSYRQKTFCPAWTGVLKFKLIARPFWFYKGTGNFATQRKQTVCNISINCLDNESAL